MQRWGGQDQPFMRRAENQKLYVSQFDRECHSLTGPSLISIKLVLPVHSRHFPDFRHAALPRE